ESFEINVVAGAEVTAPASYPGDAPTAPSDALILGDIILQNGTTVINTSDIKLDRRQDFVWTQAENIGVTAGSWAKIDSTSDHVQDALDSVDTELISRDASGYVDQDLLADGTVDLGSSSQPWGAIWHKGDIRHDGSGTPVVGDATNHYNNGHFDSLKIYTQLEAHTGSPPLGDATNRFDAHLNAATVYTGIAASATGKYLGSASAQFNLFSNLITHYGALKGTVNFNTAKQIVVRIPLGTVIPTGNWGFAAVYYQNTTSTESLYYYFTVPEDVSLDAVRIRWYEATSANMAATLESLDEDNSPTTVAGPTTIGGFDANRWDSIGGGSLAEVIDRTTTTYRVKALTGSTNTQRVLGLELTLDVTDILAAALGSC
ncbi:MAG: hypothetical protein GTN69_01855, partial [Armatimonadetes bacterium]|nr:hypothetical protein [Armatimonadota bacterium]